MTGFPNQSYLADRGMLRQEAQRQKAHLLCRVSPYESVCTWGGGGLGGESIILQNTEKAPC